MIESLAFKEPSQVVKLLLCFTGEAHDQRGAHHGIRQLLPQLTHQSFVDIRLPGTVHGSQHFGVAVLERQIEIGKNVGDIPVSGDHFRSQACGVGVMNPNPGNLHFAEGPEQVCKPRTSVDVQPVIGGDLADQNQFLNALFRQLMGFCND